MLDRVPARRRVVPGPHAEVVLGEVPARAPRKVNQLRISAAHDGDGATRRDSTGHPRPEPGDQPPVVAALRIDGGETRGVSVRCRRAVERREVQLLHPVKELLDDRGLGLGQLAVVLVQPGDEGDEQASLVDDPIVQRATHLCRSPTRAT